MVVPMPRRSGNGKHLVLRGATANNLKTDGWIPGQTWGYEVTLPATLHDEFGIFTFQRTGIAKGDCVRVTPALYNTPGDADRLVAALKVVASRA